MTRDHMNPHPTRRLRIDAAEGIGTPEGGDLQSFAAEVRDELRPRGRLERVLSHRIAEAARNLDEASPDGEASCGEGRRWLVDLDRSTRILQRWRRLGSARRVEDVPAEIAGPDHWLDRLVLDPTVSGTSPVVRGTWITVEQVVSRIVDGWSWADILRAHPEMVEDDLRACLAYAVEG